MASKRKVTLLVPQLDRDMILYLAGLFDGEGCAHIGRTKKNGRGYCHLCYSAEVKIVLTHEGVIRLIAEKLKRPYTHIKARAGENWQDTYRVNINDMRGTIAFLDQLVPYLIVKKEVAETVLAFCKSRNRNWPSDNYNRGYTEYELQLCETIKKLNQRGRRRTDEVLPLPAT